MIQSLTWDAYQSARGVSNSMLKWIAPPLTPAHYRARFITGELTDEDTEPKRTGRLVHRCLLEPDSMTCAFYVRPEGMNFTTKEGKAWRADHQDRPILTADEAQSAKRMRDAVWAHPVASGLLKGAKTEVCVFAENKEGQLLKGRIDALPQKGNTVPDVKTVEKIDEASLEKSILTYRWHCQGAFYLDLLKLAGIERAVFAFIFMEKNPPYCVTVRTLGQDAEDIGRRVYRADLARLRECQELNRWPGPTNDGDDIYLPAYAMKEALQ